jgi:hypothetical protein
VEFPKVYQAAKRFKGAEWSLCDALVAEIPAGRHMAEAIARCSRELASQGIEFTPAYLLSLHGVGRKFVGLERDELTPRSAMAAGTPAVANKARKIAETEGKPLTQRVIRDTARAALRPTKHLPQKQRIHAAAEQPVSEIRRQVNMGKLEVLALKAAKAGRDFVGAAAGQELDDTSREVLRSDIEKVLMVWKAAASTLNGRSISDEAEAFLESLGG